VVVVVLMCHFVCAVLWLPGTVSASVQQLLSACSALVSSLSTTVVREVSAPSMPTLSSPATLQVRHRIDHSVGDV
jgi:hypothetical protein